MFQKTTKKNSGSILVVNSEPDIADLFAEMLLMDFEKYIVTTAYTGKDCLLSLKKDKPDLVLVDMELSDMSGWKLIDRIKELENNMPVVAISSKSPRITDFSRLSMVSDYLMKPVTLDSLQIAVRDALQVPFLFDKYIETARKNSNKETNIQKKDYILLLKQIIVDRKRYVLMRQLYPEKVLKNNSETKVFLEALREKINIASIEIETFKNRDCLISTI